MVYVLITAFLAILIYLLFRKKRPAGAGHASMNRLPANMTEEQVSRQIKRLKERYPGKSENWYIEKIISDYERDRS